MFCRASEGVFQKRPDRGLVMGQQIIKVNFYLQNVHVALTVIVTCSMDIIAYIWKAIIFMLGASVACTHCNTDRFGSNRLNRIHTAPSIGIEAVPGYGFKPVWANLFKRMCTST